VIPVETALEMVLASAPRLSLEDVPLDDALGRVLAQDVASDLDMPPFDRSAMDGFAVRAEDVVGAPVIQYPEAPLPAGQAIQIMTGAPVPPGASAVQQVEKTRSVDGGRRVEILVRVEAGANVARRGSEAQAGDVVLRAGETIDPAAIAVLAATGNGRVRVGRRPVVAVLVTGDELVGVEEAPRPGRIRNSNGPALLAQARWCGAEVLSLGVVPDETASIAAAVDEGLHADVLVVSGGVSAGVYDLVEGVFARFGVEVSFDKVALKPGAPLVFGRRGDTLVFGLPGNPVSAQVTFDLFVRAALLRMQGARVTQRPTVEAELLAPVRNRSGRQAHVPARVRYEGGRLVADPIRSMGSADVVAHARANAVLVIAADRAEARAGERAPARLLGSFLERDGAS
jgi:molybdopterin molybdotransferase